MTDCGASLQRLLALSAMLLAFGCARASPDIEIPRDASLDDGDNVIDATKPDDGSKPNDGSKLNDGSQPDAAPSKRCATNDDCAASLVGAVCDSLTGQCAQCTPTQDTCPPGQVCDPMNNTCRVGCASDSDCGATPGRPVRCDPTSRRCVGCTEDTDCALGSICREGACVPGCTASHACGIGTTCCDGQCHDPQTDAMHCGACGMSCGEGSACCAGTCQRTASDTDHCGRCGNVCAVPHGSPVCTAGVCGTGTCDTGYGDCDRDSANGCEADLSTDASNCGACGRACPSGPNATARCTAGSCRTECAGGYGDCDGNPANGCETSLNNTAAHCGMCARACPSGPGATATCSAGTCGIQCAVGVGDCDGNPANGCEVNTNTNASNCGACGVACAFPNGNASCIGGRCALSNCRAGFDNCDGDATNGCETPVNSDSTNCGRCGNRCPAGTACSMGSCSSVCTGGTTFCGDRCATLETDTSHCGACGRACPGGANGTPACRGGVCGLTCATGFGDCDGSSTTGCETNLRAATEHCGACGRVCGLANASATCSDASCRVGGCNVGYSNCNGLDADGCETNINADVTNCGGCGRVCNMPNAGASCIAGSCRVGACSPGFANCNGVDADGCEINLSNNNFNCGRCGTSCPPGTACSGSTCNTICTGGTTYCGGACVSTATDTRNCGACGNVCGIGQSCVSGLCRTAGPANDTCAGAQTISLSLTNQTITTTTVGASNNLSSPCGYAGADVWFRFTLGQRELVYADTQGSSFDTILYFATSCTSALSGTPPTGMNYCNDDMWSAGCDGGGLQSMVTAVLPAGTYYLVLAGYGSSTGSATLRFQHLPVGNNVTFANVGSNTYSGTTLNDGPTAYSCYSAAPEALFWWKTCPSSSSGTVTATTCSRASWDTLLALRSGDGEGDTCNDDACGLQSSLTSTISGTPGLHAVYVDGYASGSGSFSLQLSRP